MAKPVSSFATRLLRWFDQERRDLPWRRCSDPWAIWVSEIMLQQTRVEAVRTAYERFMLRYATPAAFAVATDDDLLLAWRGLGYYRRARLLREGARLVVAEHGGRVPSRVEDLARLPGIGAYTLGAVASIAFGHIEVAIDGNVERVTARHKGIRADVRSPAARRQIRAIGEERLDRHRPGDSNQAMMELGALVCTPTSPACDRCPVAADCVARATGLTRELPVRKPPRTPVLVTARVALALGSRGALGARIAKGEPNAGQVELPGAGMLASIGDDELGASVRERFGAELELGNVVATIRHAITHHRVHLHAHAAQVRAPGRLQWFPVDDATPWTTPSRKVFQQALGLGRDLRT